MPDHMSFFRCLVSVVHLGVKATLKNMSNYKKLLPGPGQMAQPLTVLAALAEFGSQNPHQAAHNHFVIIFRGSNTLFRLW